MKKDLNENSVESTLIKKKFDIYIEAVKIYNRIIESTKQSTKN